MNTRLSKREKIILFIGAVMLLCYVGIQFALMPAYRLYHDKQEEYDRLLLDKSILDIKLQNERLTRTARDDAQAAYHDVIARFPELLPNEQIDQLLTGICTQNRLTPTMLGISSLQHVTVNAAGGASAEAAPTVYGTVAANMNLVGDYAALQDLITMVNDIEYLRLTQVTYTDSSQAGLRATANLTVVFEVTMLLSTP